MMMLSLEVLGPVKHFLDLSHCSAYSASISISFKLMHFKLMQEL
jgi:hypothetical protein